MENTKPTQARMRARDAAFQRLNRLTSGAAIAAFAGLGVFTAVSAATIPGTSSSTHAAGSASASSSTDSTSSSSSDASSGTVQSSSGVGSASSGTGTVVSGGS
jgi:hypothetical protein